MSKRGTSGLGVWAPGLILAAVPISLFLHVPFGRWLGESTYLYLRAFHPATAVVLAALGVFVAVHEKGRKAVLSHLEGFDKIGARSRRIWLGVAWAGLFAFYFFLKYVQYRSFQLPMDTAMTVNLAYNALHGLGLESSLYGTNFWAFHFQPFIYFYGLLIFLHNSAMTLMAVQAATTASIPIAVYLLAKEKSGSEVAAVSAFLVTVTSHFLMHVVATNVQAPLHLPAFFLWSLYFAELKKWRWAGLLSVLALSTSEQAPFAYMGLGLYLAWNGRAEKSGLRRGPAVFGVAAAVFVLEMLLMYSYPAEMRYKNWGDTYGHLGVSPGDSLKFMLFSPLEFAGKVLWPLERYRTLFIYLVTTGFSAAFVPATALVWGFNFGPSFLSPTGSAFHTGTLHYAAQLGGPFWWASALGAAALFSRLKKRKRGWWMLPGALFFAAFNSYSTKPIIWVDGSKSLYESAPDILKKVPVDASLWANEWVTPWVAGRSFLKSIPTGPRRDFLSRLFLPDYILFRKDWIAKADEAFSLRVLTLMKREGFLKTAENADLILYRHPESERRGAKGLELPASSEEGRKVRSALLAKWAKKYIEERFATANRLFATGAFSEAAAVYEEIVRLKPRMAVAYTNLGAAQYKSGQVREATVSFRRALAIEPGRADAKRNLELLEREGERR